MKEDLCIKIRKNILEAVLTKMTPKDGALDEIIEDALMVYYGLKIQDVLQQYQDGNKIEILNQVNHGYYVYVFLDPTIKEKRKLDIESIAFNFQPFYFGKGAGERIFQEERNELVNQRILKIKSAGQEPIKLKIKEGLSNLEAIKLESYLIHKIGRADLGLGPLLNLSSGVIFKNPEDLEFEFSDLNLEKNINSMILDAMNQSKTLKLAAKKLGISERTLFRKIHDLRIEKSDGKYFFGK